MERFDEALHRIQSDYDGPLPKGRSLTYTAIRGMLGAVGDRYTRFLSPDQFRRMQEENSGEFGGVGIVLTLNSLDQAVITQIDTGGPARRAGVRTGDIVLAVAGHPIPRDHRAAERAQDLIHGDPNTPVNLVLRRRARRAPLRLTLVRRLVYTPTVTSRMLGQGIGYIRLDSFGERSDEEIGAALRRLKPLGMRALVFDLRGNPGGYFNAAIDIASRFIDHGPVVYTRDRDGVRVPVPSVPAKRLSPRVPLAVLVDRWSASAAEIVAAAIQDDGAGVLIGQPTYGKALVQTINPIPDGSALLVTTHHYYTPLGKDISHRGVMPNIPFDPHARTATGQDASIQRAVAWLNDPSRGRVSTRH